MKCNLCNSELALFHEGTRDRDNVSVMKCPECGLLQLSDMNHISSALYEQGLMRKNQYSSNTDKIGDLEYKAWINDTKNDDERRYNSLKALIADKRVLDFGCGNGGFIRRAKESAALACGVELDIEARNYMLKEGISVEASLEKYYEESFDVITMFHVLEHLTEPVKYLEIIRTRLKKDGLLIIETPNANDALISKYSLKEFQDFTFWSEHVYLYNSHNMQHLLENCGYRTMENSQLQRYTLANHLYWLVHSKPGGHCKWLELNDAELNKQYERVLKGIESCDTLWGIFKKGV